MIISKKRINSLKFLEKYDIKKIKVGIQVSNEELKKVGVEHFEEGLAFEPSPQFGISCARNTNGYSYADKSKPKEYRTVNTIEWQWKDWSGKEYSEFRDISKWVYQKIFVNPTNIEFVFTKNNKGDKFLVATENCILNKSVLKQTINMFLEVFGFCEIFTKDLDLISTKNKIKRCNWELLPKGIRIKIENIRSTKTNAKRKDFNQYRLDVMDSYDPEEVYQGTGGFVGYYAYIFKNNCFLENAVYGNATYIVPKEKWVILSKLSKQELLKTKEVIEKVNHNQDWEMKIENLMIQLKEKEE